MDYSRLNSFLNNLEVDNSKPNNDFNYQIYNETQRFGNKNVEENNGLNKKKAKQTYENISINRNNEMVNISGLNPHFNFERVNPQRDLSINKKMVTENQDNSYSLNRQLLTKDLTNKRTVNVFDNTQFSEDFKTYNDFRQNGISDGDSINNKLSNREMAPSLSTMPKTLWK